MQITESCLVARSLDDQGLNQRLHDVPKNAVILLEVLLHRLLCVTKPWLQDVDAVFVERTAADSGMYGDRRGVTFSGLLNGLDGGASQEGRLLFSALPATDRIALLIRAPCSDDE